MKYFLVLFLFLLFFSYPVYSAGLEKKNIYSYEFSNFSPITNQNILKMATAKNKTYKEGVLFRNSGIVLFTISMLSFQIALAADIVAIVLGEFDILIPDKRLPGK
jgi:hypothetical protein